MNRYFEDARYYAKRAGETTVRGVREELAPVTERFERLTGEDEDAEPTRLEAVRTRADRAVARARAEARRAVDEGREKLAAVRSA